MVYPGRTDPSAPFGGKSLGESLNDYALLQTLGIPVDSPQLRGFKGYDDYPKDGQWYQQTRAVLLATKASRLRGPSRTGIVSRPEGLAGYFSCAGEHAIGFPVSYPSGSFP